MLVAWKPRPEHMIAFDMDSMHAPDVFERGQQRRPIIGTRIRHVVRLTCERIVLLAETACLADRLHEFLTDQRNFGVVAIVFQRSNRPLIGQSLRLARPTVVRRVFKQRVVGCKRRQRHRRPKFVGIQQMVPDKRVGHFLREDAIPHATQIIVGQRLQKTVVLVAVVASSFLRPP